MRALDKYDRLGREQVELLLGPGRRDESGDFTPGAKLDPQSIKRLAQLLTLRLHVEVQTGKSGPVFNPLINTGQKAENNVVRTLTSTIASIMRDHVEESQGRDVREIRVLEEGLRELEEIGALIAAAGYDDGRIIMDPSVVRGLEYYTGPVFEAELTFEVKDDDGKPVRFGSVGGGGRYDDLVARFTGETVPATGFSIGVSRLQAALSLIGEKKSEALGPVVVLVMDKGEVATYQKMTQALRNAGIRAEMYLGSSGMKAQMKYADKRNSPCVIIQGSDERAKGEVTIKDLIEGAKAAAAIKDNKEWKEARPAQFSVSESNLIQEVHKLIKRHQD